MSSEKWIPVGSPHPPGEESCSNMSSISDDTLTEYEEGEIVTEKVVRKDKKVLWKPPVSMRSLSPERPRERKTSTGYCSTRSPSPSDHSQKRKSREERTSSRSRNSRDNDDSSEERYTRKRKQRDRSRSRTPRHSRRSADSSPERTRCSKIRERSKSRTRHSKQSPQSSPERNSGIEVIEVIEQAPETHRKKTTTRLIAKKSPDSSLERNSKIEQELESYRDTLKTKRKHFQKNPEGHPCYDSVRKNFLSRQPFAQDRRQLRDEWKKHWRERLIELDEKLVHAKKLELLRKHCISEVDKRIAKSKKHEDKDSDNKKRKREASDTSPPSPHHVALTTRTQLASPSKDSPPGSVVPTSAALLEASLKTEEPAVDNAEPLPSQSAPLPPDSPLPSPTPPPPPATPQSLPESCNAVKQAEPDSSPTLVQTLTLLGALEDNLGSLGATVNVVLSRVLSAERQQPGSSSSLLHEVVDLIDTCKMKLIGQLEMELIEGARAVAAQSTVNKIDRLLQTVEKQPVVPVVPVVPIVPIPIRPVLSSLPSQPPPLMPAYPELGQVCHSAANVTPEPFDQQMIADSSTNLGPLTGSPGQEAKYNNNNNNVFIKEEFVDAEVQQFTAADVFMLIQNFAYLKDVQKRHLIDYLRQLEGVSSSCGGSARHTSAELSGKSQAVESTSSCHKSQRFPIIYSMTGLTASDLEKFGLPVDEIGALVADSSTCETIETAPSSHSMPRISANKRDPRLNPLLRQARKQQMKPCQ